MSHQLDQDEFDNHKEPPSPIASKIILVLDHFNSEMNIAHMFRLSDGLLLKEIIILGHSEPPWAKINRLSRSTLKSTPYRFMSLDSFLNDHKPLNGLAIEWTNDSESGFDLPSVNEVDYVFLGSERSGLSESLLSLCKRKVHIPMSGNIRSMNVAMAGAIALYQIIHG